jgi:GT2 family glycosyltransferase
MVRTVQAAISICLPTFNGGRFLAEAIESVLAQVYNDWELIITDDGSTDDSRKIAESYCKLDSRIRLLDPAPRLGLFGNYNRSMAAAQGQFVKPFAQDDVLEPMHLKKVMQVFETHPAVALVSTARIAIDEHGNQVRWVCTERSAKFNKPGEQPLEELRQRLLMPVENLIGEPSTVAFRRKFVGTGFDTKFSQLGDFEYWLRILQNGSYYFLDEPLCRFRRHSESATSQNERSLSFVPDLILLSKSPAFDGLSTEQFLQANFQASGVQVLNMSKSAKIADSGSLFAEEQNQLLKETLLHSLLHIGKMHERTHALLAIRAYDALTKKRERHLMRMLSSSAWKLTRPLRELNRGVLPRPHKERYFGPERAGPLKPEEIVSQQRSYLAYLRHEIIAVRTSRSWRLTNIFRRALR